MRAPAKICGGAARRGKAVPQPQDDGETVPLPRRAREILRTFCGNVCNFSAQTRPCAGAESGKKDAHLQKKQAGRCKRALPCGLLNFSVT